MIEEERIEELEGDLALCRKQFMLACDDLKAERKELHALQEKLAIAKEALEFYAIWSPPQPEQGVYSIVIHGGTDGWKSFISKAKEALDKINTQTLIEG